MKTIIFVKDRSVAVYLKKLLAGDDKEHRASQSEVDPDDNAQDNPEADGASSHYQSSREFITEGLLDKKHFRIGFAMGFKTKNIVNKAYRALNTDQISMYQDVLG